MYQSKIKPKNKIDTEIEKRCEPRYVVDCELIIFCESEFVTRKANNLSNTGLCLSEPLPQSFIDKKLEITLSHLNENSKNFDTFFGFLIEDSLQRINVKHTASGSKPQLENYVLD